MIINRPDYNDYDDTQYEQSIYPYCRDLEEYCDELEQQIRNLQFQDHIHYEEYLGYEKALDRACDILARIDRSYDTKEPRLSEYEWKVRLLENEK